ncbi:hypothetical protein OSB04_016367 [Centaurea solstitialis]|uniref:Reverse transcriptase Ty1/copia-type domain-containing protein n=1 Tax=Centaurea solstitialis TaxID=347529 RepID=A0AA38W8E7_9ASTR|nr:hypothetical protein OSB04_016367 [Centaurea solstitialis]
MRENEKNAQGQHRRHLAIAKCPIWRRQVRLKWRLGFYLVFGDAKRAVWRSPDDVWSFFFKYQPPSIFDMSFEVQHTRGSQRNESENTKGAGTQGHPQAFFGNSGTSGHVQPHQPGLLGAPPAQSCGVGPPQPSPTMFGTLQQPPAPTFHQPLVTPPPYYYGQPQFQNPVQVPPQFGQPTQQSMPAPPPPQPSFVGHASQYSQPQYTDLSSVFQAMSVQLPQDNNFYMDTGASRHMTFNQGTMHSLTPCNSSFIQVGNGVVVPARYIGQCNLPFSSWPLKLRNVLVSDALIKNLISARRFIIDNSVSVEFDPFGFTVKDLKTGSFLQRCHSDHHDLYPVLPPSPQSAVASANVVVSFDVWHRRLGHPVDTSSPPPDNGSSPSVSSSQSPSAEPSGTSSTSSAPVASSGHPMTTRSRTGSLKPKQIFNLAVTSDISPIPRSVAQAMCDPHWRAAMDAEMAALLSNHTWDLVPKPSVANIVGSRWLFRHKFDSNGRLERYKGRLVAQGFSQQPGLDFDDTFSPIVKPATIRTVLSISISRNWPIHQLDVKNAFLHGDLTETVYMRQPPGYVDSNFPDHVCRLRKALYGLKQAPRAWYQRFAVYLSSLGFLSSKTDTSLFTYHHGSDTIYLLLYVDDIILTASSPKLISMVISQLSSEFPMSDLGPTPADTKTKLAVDGEPVSDPTLYRSLVGALQYLTFTRPDIAYAVQQVCLFMHDPRLPHFNALKRILRYLKGTLSHGLHIKASAVDRLVAYSDADWAGCPNTRRSTSGFCVYLGDNLVFWSSKRQHVVSRSSAEAEYRGIANVVAEAAWLRNLLLELYCPLSRATVVFCDNVSAMYLASNPVQHQRTKHVEIDLHFVRERVAIGHVRVLHVPSAYQYADIFTKGLPTSLFLDFRNSLNIRLPPDQTTGVC